MVALSFCPANLNLRKFSTRRRFRAGLRPGVDFCRTPSQWPISGDPANLARALLYTDTGRVTLISPLPGGGWGGARNRVVSRTLAMRHVAGLHRAALAAIEAGLPFNRFMTVNWHVLGVADAEAARATGRLIKLASDWCATKGVRMAWAWVRENDDGDGSRGSHVHIVLHCPAGIALGNRCRAWLKRVTGRPYRKGGVASRSIGPTLKTYAANFALYRANLAAVLDYMTKGTMPGVGGRIVGKRAAWWQRRGR